MNQCEIGRIYKNNIDFVSTELLESLYLVRKNDAIHS